MARVLALLGLPLLLTGCVTPALTSEDYRTKAIETSHAGASALRTAMLAGTIVERHDMDPPVVDIVLSESEDILGSVGATFASIQPPSSSDDALRDRVLRLIDGAEEAVENARIAFRRGLVEEGVAHLRAAATTARSLEDLARDLE